MEASLAFLDRANRVYQLSLDRVRTARGDEQTLERIRDAAWFAAHAHAGLFADDALENLAFDIGLRLREPSYAGAQVRTSLGADRRRVLHVATSLYATGGHTRLIRNWAAADPSSIHSVLILQQWSEPPSWFERTINQSGGTMTTVPAGTSLIDQASRVRAVARRGADLVVLHTHPEDPTPVVAFATSDAPPVFLMNHADHVFWLGPSVADHVLCFRPWGERIARTRRSIRSSSILPLALTFETTKMSREDARSRFGLSPDAPMLISIASPYKFNPQQSQNFYRVAVEILRRHPRAQLHMIGVTPDHARRHLTTLPPRLYLPGRVEDVTGHISAADLYLQSFPYSSHTALLDAAAAAICPVLAHSPIRQVRETSGATFEGIATHTENEAEYLSNIDDLIRDPNRRRELASAAAERVRSLHAGESWSRHLHAAYEVARTTSHAPARIDKVRPQALDDDLDRAAFCASQLEGASMLAVEAGRPDSSLGSAVRLFALSVRIGDTRLRARTVRQWASVLRRKLA